VYDDPLDQVLESLYLNDQLSLAQEMFASVGHGALLHAPYILDIDLDYFHTDQSIRPNDLGTFYRLIQGAAGITIATEPWFVMDGRMDGANITSDELLDIVMNYIYAALC